MYNNLKKVFTLVMGLTAFGLFNTASADWRVNEGGIGVANAQDVVVSLKSNPMANPEAACLAVTFARSLSAPPPESIPEAFKNVTLFVTLDGVSLARDKVLSSRRFKCDTPWGEISLEENLLAFLTEALLDENGDEVLDENGDVVEVLNQNKLVVCPLCWNSRYDDELPDYGVLPGYNGTSPKAIGIMIFNADKILDF